MLSYLHVRPQNPSNKRCEGKVLPRVTSEECKFIKEQDDIANVSGWSQLSLC